MGAGISQLNRQHFKKYSISKSLASRYIYIRWGAKKKKKREREREIEREREGEEKKKERRRRRRRRRRRKSERNG